MEQAQEKKKKGRGGRPEQTIKRDIRLTVRLTKKEHFILLGRAGQAALTPSEYIRQLAIKGKVISRLTAEQMQLVRQLAGLSNNINQVARICHRESLFEAMKYFEHYRTAVDAVIQKLEQ